MLIAYSIVRFWIHHPSLFYGISLLLGVYASIYGFLTIILPSLGLWLPFFCLRDSYKPCLLSLSLFLAAWSFVNATYEKPLLPENGLPGTAHLSILSLAHQSTPFGGKWIYLCEIKGFYPDNNPSYTTAKNRKCTVSIMQKEDLIRPPADKDYLIHGRLVATPSGQLMLKIVKNEPWQGINGTSSLAEARYTWKLKAKEWIFRHFENRKSATFLAGLATGNFDDHWMRQEFARFGLQHIMAISGFHFAIIAGLISFLLRFIFSRKMSAIVLLTMMSGYCFFLGSNASVLRAWLMCSVTLVSYLIEKQGVSLNSLGVALIGVLAFDPLLSQTLAFQFSFLTTAAILLMYAPIDQLLSRILIKRPLSEVIEMNGLNQHGYVVLAIFRQSLSLTLAVNLFALPLTLFYFQQFPVMGILYNFFFPFLVTGSLCLLMLGMLFSSVPYLSTALHILNNSYTEQLLKFTYRLPSEGDRYITLDSFPIEILILWLCVCSSGFIKLRDYLKVEREESFAFI